MYIKNLINTILLISLFAGQIAFINGLPAYFNNINLILVVLVFILGLNGFKPAILWSLGLGVCLDLFSFLPFGVFTFSLVMIVIILHILLVRFFTNRTLYTFLALTTIATVCFKVVFLGLKYLIIVLGFVEQNIIINQKFVANELTEIALNAGIAILIFYFINFISNRLKPVFIFRTKKSQT